MKRVLLDENVDRRLKRFFDDGFDVLTVVEEGWGGLKNGKLLSVASNSFDVLVTMDSNLQYQQQIGLLDLAIVVIRARSNQRHIVEPMMPKVNEAIRNAESGSVIVVGI